MESGLGSIYVAVQGRRFVAEKNTWVKVKLHEFRDGVQDPAAKQDGGERKHSGTAVYP